MAENINTEMRINFDGHVPDLLYRQAGGRCSVPRCTNPTMGPYYNIKGAVNLGIACHIYSASKDGPRGWGDKDEAFIKSEANGLWCCAVHGNVIDKKNGRDYPVSQLFAWKALAEARVLKQINDSPSPLGWVETVEFTRFNPKIMPPKVQLSRCTLLWSAENGTGKSALMQLAASISDAGFAERFLGDITKYSADEDIPTRFAGKVTYSTVDTLSKVVQLEFMVGELVRRIGTTTCLLPPGDVAFIFCERDPLQRLNGEDDLDLLMRVLDLDKSALLALARLSTGVLMAGDFRFSHVEEDIEDKTGDKPQKRIKEDGSPYMELSFKKARGESFISFAGLSGSEHTRLVLDLFISKAREVAKERLTLLMLDDIVNSLDDGNFGHLLDALSKESFQSLVVLPPRKENSFLNVDGDAASLGDENRFSEWRVATLPATHSPA